MIHLYRKSVFLALLSGFLFFSVNSAAQVSFSGGVAPTMCVGNPSYVTISPIVISENSPTNFTGITGTPGTFSIEPTAASRFEFEPGMGSVVFSGQGAGAVTASIVVNTTTITITLTESDNTNETGVLNTITISGIRVRAINAAASLLLERVNPASTIVINGFTVGSDITSSSLVSNEPPSISEAGPAQNVCGTLTTLNADAPAVGVGQWSFISNPDGLGAIGNINNRNSLLSGAAGSTYVLQWSVSNGVCTPSIDNVSIHFDGIPTPANAGTSQQKCNNGSFVLAGNAPTTGVGSWSVLSGSAGITSPFSPTSSVTGVAVGTSAVLRWSISNGVCAPTTSDVTLTNYSLPSSADAGVPSITQCNTSTFAMNATAPLIGSGVWSVVSGSAAITNANSPNTTITGITAGNTATLRWTVSNGVCAFTQDDIILTNDPAPSVSNAGTALNQCNNGNFTLAATPAVTGTGGWSIIGLPNGAVITTPSSPTSTITGLIAGNSVTLRWTITSGSCTPSTSDVVLTNYATPTVANAGPATLTQCNNATFTMSATPAAIGTGTWTIVSGAAVITNINSPTTTITGVTTTATLRWTVGNGVCATTQDDIILTNDPSPSVSNAGTALNQCNNGNFTLAATPVVTGTGGWSIIGAANGAVITTLSSPTSTVTGLIAGNSVTLRWTITSGSCTPSTSDVVLTNYATPTVANAGPATLTQCNNATFTMSATPAAIGTGTWTIVSGAAVITNINSPTTTITGVTTTATLRWTVGNGVCATTQDDIILTNDPAPSLSNAGTALNQCNNGNFTLAATPAVTGTGGWSIIGLPNGAVITTPSSPTSTITGLIAGNSVTLRWTITSGSCTPSTSDVVLTNYATPTVANAGPATLTQCNNATFTMSATPAAIGTGTWTIVSGAAVITNINSPTTTITGVTTTATLRWTVGNGVCATTQDDIILTNDPAPSLSNAGTALNQCNNGNFTLAATPAVTGTGGWSIIGLPNGAVITTPSSPTSTITGLIAGNSVTLRWTITSGSCTPSTSDVVLTNYATPTVANAGPATLTQCNNATFTMSATPAAIGTGTWTIVSGAAVITNINSPTTTITGVTTTATLRWTVGNGVCATTQDDIILTNDPAPSLSNAGTALNQCNNGNFTLAATPAVTGTGGWSIIGLPNGAVITTPSSPTSTITGLIAGNSVTLRWTITSGSCTPSTSDVVLTNYATPTVANAGPATLTQCNNATFTMSATPAAIGTGTWTIVSGAAVITNINSPTTTITGVTTTATLRWTVGNGVCATTQDDIILTNDPSPSVSNAGTALNQCNNGNFTLAATPAVTGTGGWSIIGLPNGAVITTPSLPTSTITGLIAGNSVTLRWTITSGSCTPSTSDVVLTNYATPTVANAGPATLTQCNNATFTMSATPAAIGTGTWTIVSGAAVITNINSPTTTITGVTTTATLRWTVGNGVCATTQDDIILTNDPAPSLSNAGTALNQCNNGNFTLAATPAVTGTGGWSIIGLPNGAVITTPSSPTSTITGLIAGNSVTLRWTITSGSCTPSTSDVVLTNYATPTVANAGPATLTQCNNATFTMSATPAAIGTGTWTIVSGAAVITNINSPTTTITGVTTTATLRWTVGNGVCATTQDDIILTNDPAPSLSNAGTALNQCNNGNFTLAATPAVTGTGGWSIIGLPNGAVITTPSSPTSTITGLIAGNSVTLRWTITSGSCTPSTSDVVLTNYATPTVANAGPATLTQCNNATFTMSATPAAIGTGTWTIVSGAAVITNINSPTTTITGVTTTATLRWTVGNGVCATTQDDIILTNDPSPSVSNAGTALNQCNNGNFTLAATPAVTGTGGWSIIGLPNGAVITTPSLPTSTITGLIAGNSVTLRWTITSGSCTPSTSDVVLTNYATPTVANAGPATLTQCNNATFTMSATPAAIGTGTWTIVSGAAVITNINSPTTTITGVTTTATLRWTVGNGVCATTQDDIILTNDPAPSLSNAGTALNQCNNGNFTLAATPAVTGTGGWSIIGLPNGAVITTPSSPTSTVTGLIAGNSVTLRWTITSGSCTPSTSNVVLTNYLAPLVNAGSDASTCEGSIFNFTSQTILASATNYSSIQWLSVGIPPTGVLYNATTLTPTYQPGTGETGIRIFRLTANGNGVCTPVFDEMQITIVPKPIVEAGSNAQVCQGTPTFNFGTRSIVASTSNGSRVWSHNGGGSFVDATQLSPIYNVNASDVGNTITFTLTVTSGSPTVCSIVQDQFQLQVNPRAIVTVPASYTTCEPAIINLSGTIAGGGSSGSWSIIPGMGAGTLSVSSLTGSGPTVVNATYDSASADVGNILGFRLTSNDPDGSGPCTTVSSDVNITIDQAARISAGPDLEICEYSSVPLNGIVGGSASSVTWTGGSGSPQFANPNAAITTYTLTNAEKAANNVSFTFTLTTNDPAGVCPAAMDQVQIVVNDTLNFVTFLNLDPVYQEDAPSATLAGVPPGGTFLGPGIIGGTNTFVPDFANLGVNTIMYTYTDPATGCVSRPRKTTIVNPVTDIEFDVYFSPNLPLVQVPEVGGIPQICATIRPGDVLLKGDPDVLDADASTISPPVFTITPDVTPSYIFKKLDGQFYLNTKNLPPGDYVVKYTYTNQFEAETEFSKQVHVSPAPKAIIDVGNSCVTSSVSFTHSSGIPNNSIPAATLVGFNWDYGNGVGSTESAPPPYSYPSSGMYDIMLEVVTSDGCRHDTLKSIRIGSVPDMKFAWSAFCQGNDTKFTDQTVVTVGAIAQYTWMFGDGNSVTSPYGTAFVNDPVPPAQSNGGITTGTFANPHHQYGTFNSYDVTLQVETTDGCVASLTREAFILSYGTPSPITGYFEDFEIGQGSWFATRSDINIPTDTSWVFGPPSGSQINTAASGSVNAWWTGGNPTPVNENSTYYNNEKSAVIGPCINLLDIKRPMISLDYWSDGEPGSDGAVLQYSTDGGQTWISTTPANISATIGDNTGGGINWYNGSALTGNPGLQNIGQYGWTGQQGGWKNARYNLDVIPKAYRAEVIFRISFGSNNDNSANPTAFNGFAFDNVFIGEKKRNVLVEYFTNSSVLNAFNTYFDNFYNSQMLLNDSSDFFKIQYHTSRPLPDLINEQNKLDDPDDRASFYGITEMPSGVMDGIDGDYYGQNLDGLHLNITEEILDRRALEDPLFDIKIDTLPATGTSISLHVEFKYISTAALNNPVTFQVALVEDSLSVTGVPMQRNVLRKFLLGSSGKTVSTTWLLNQTMSIDTVIQLTVPIGANNNQLHLVAFVQERGFDSNVIYQSSVYKLGVKSQAILTGVDDPVLAQIKDIAIYPNPATRYINFATDASLTRDFQYTIVDQRGITMLSGNLNRDLTIPQQVELSNLADGVYIVMIHQGNRRLIQRKLAVLKR